jgi:phosphoribosylanthranilate isomerase
MTKVKICGITNLEDALICAGLDSDAIGFNFYSKSPRYVTSETIRVIVEQLPANILKVGVFVDADSDLIKETVQTAGLGAVQLHGNETPEFAKTLQEDLKRPVIKAFRVSSDFKAEDVLHFDVDAILLDAYSPAMYGGTGESFDWEIARQVRRIFPKMYLAGGLSPDNVRIAIADVTPFAVDVSSSVESSPGKKDHELLRRFIAEAKNND